MVVQRDDVAMMSFEEHRTTKNSHPKKNRRLNCANRFPAGSAFARELLLYSMIGHLVAAQDTTSCVIGRPRAASPPINDLMEPETAQMILGSQCMMYRVICERKEPSLCL